MVNYLDSKRIMGTENPNGSFTTPTALTDYMKRVPLTINGAKKTANPTFDFTSSTGWASTGSNVTIDTATDERLESVIPNTINLDDAQSYDLTTTSDEKWVLRFKFDNHNFVTNTTGNAKKIIIGLSSADHATASDANQYGIGILFGTWSSGTKIRTRYSNGGNWLDGGGSDMTQTFADNDIFYVEVVRTSSTKFRVTLYSDSDYSEVLDTQEETIPDTITGLQHIKVQINTTPTAPNGTWESAIDDMEFWNGESVIENIPAQQTALLSDDFNTDDWTQVGTAIVVDDTTDERVEFTNLPRNAEHKLHYNLGSEISDSLWHFDFKVAITSSSTTGNGGVWIGLVNSSNEIHTGSVDALLVNFFDNNISGTDLRMRIQEYNGGSLTASGSSNALSLSTDYYCRFIRTSTTTIELRIYTDSARTQQVGSTITKTINASTGGLDFVQLTSQDVSDVGTVSGYIDDVVLHENITEVNPSTLTDEYIPIKILGQTELQRKTTETFQDDFDTDDWTDTVSARAGVDTTNEYLAVDESVSSANHVSYYDLGVGNVSDSKWTLDFDITGTTITASTNSIVCFGLSSSIANVTQSAQDYIYFMFDYRSTNKASVMENDNGLNTGRAIEENFTWNENQTYYVRLRRTSTTTIALDIYADKARTVSLLSGTGTTDVNITGLRYLKWDNFQDSAKGTFTGYIDNVRFWDGITNPVEQETATEEFDYASASGWTTEAGSLVAISGGVVTNGGAGNNTDHRISKPLTHNMDSKWCVDFEFDYTEGGVESGTLIMFSDANKAKPFGTGDHLGVSFSNGAQIQSASKDGSSSREYGSVTSALSSGTTYYFRTTWDGTTLTVNIYTDSDRTILFDSTSHVPSTSIGTLEYIQHSAHDNGSTGSGQSTWNVDNVKIYNGILSPNATARKFVITDNVTDDTAVQYATRTKMYDPINGDLEIDVKIPSLTTGADTTLQMYYDYQATNPSYVPDSTIESAIRIDYNDDLTSESSAWSVDTADITYDGTGDEIDFNADGTASSQVKSLDLQNSSILGENLNDTNFLARITFNHTAFSTNSTSSQNMIQFGFGSLNTDSGSAKDFIGFMVENDSTDGQVYYARPANGAGHANKGAGSQFTTSPSVTTHYVEIKRNSSSSCDVSIYSDASYSTLVETETITVTNITSLRYFLICTSRGGSENGSNAGSIEKIQIWNGITSPPTREQSTYDSNYKAVYDLNGNSLDSTVYGNDGTETSVDWEEINNDVGLQTNDTGYIDCGGTVADWKFLNNGGFYFETMIYPNTVNNNEVLFDSANVAGTNTGFYIRFETGGVLRVGLVGTVDTNVATGTIWKAGELQHLVVRHDGSTVWIYRNGIEVTSGTLTSNNANPTYVPRIGYSTNGNDFKYDGYFGYVEMSSQHKPSVVAISRYNSRKANSDFVTFGTASTPLLANVETNSIFIKTDTNKRYWYDGTSWVEQV